MTNHFEYREGEWMPARQDAEPTAADAAPAYVAYAGPCIPETGHAGGWCWWALGRMGDAPTREEAQRAAEAALARFVEERSRGVAGDRCESGNGCGRTGCPECQS